MSKELFDGQERFDGMPVTVYDGRFSGSFDIPEAIGADLEYDDVVSFVVTCHVGKATIDATKLGDMKRSNTFSVQNVTPISGKQADEIYTGQGLAVVGVNAGQLSGQLAWSDPVGEEPESVSAVVEEFIVDSEEEEDFGEEEVFSPGAVNDVVVNGPQVVADGIVDTLPDRTDKMLVNFLSEV